MNAHAMHPDAPMPGMHQPEADAARWQPVQDTNRVLVLLVVLMLAALAFEGFALFRMHADMSQLMDQTQSVAASTMPVGNAAPAASSATPAALSHAAGWPAWASLPAFAGFPDWSQFWSAAPSFQFPLAASQLNQAAVQTDDKNNYVIRFSLPGIDQNDIKVSLNGENLTVSGSGNSATETKGAHGATVGEQRQLSSFQQTLTLPGPVDATKMKSESKDGVLTVTIPKASPKGS